MTVEEMKEQKREKGYTYAQISERSGVPLGTVQKIFSGETENPRYETILALQAFFLSDHLGNQGKYPADDLVREAAPLYGARHQGEYTIDDYRALPEERRVELIDGYFYDMAAPSSVHQMINGEIHRQIANYIFDRGGSCIPIISPVDVQLDRDDKTMVQPDVLIVCNRDQVVYRNVVGAPDFVVEVVSPSSRRKDYLLKMRKYESAGVREYWLVDMKQKVVLVFFFESDACPMIYPLGDDVPVNIYNGELVVRFDRMAAWVEEMEDSKKSHHNSTGF